MPGLNRTTSGVLGGILGLVGLSAVAGILVTATVTPAIAVSGYAASSALSLFDNMPNDLRVDRPMEPTNIYAKNEDGTDFLLTTFYDQNRTPVEFDDISQNMYDALLSSEDSRFYEHGGIDLRGTTRALLNNAAGGQLQGASSITQQYVKNVLIQRCEQEAEFQTDEQQECYRQVVEAEGPEGIERKLQEVRYAVQLEQEYSKDEILLGYLNLANFGGRTYGIESAAERYFDTTAKDLTIEQSAILAGMVQNPNLYRIDLPDGTATASDGTALNSTDDGYSLTQDRKQYVLTEMLNNGQISEAEYDELYDKPIEPRITSPKSGCEAAGGSAYFCKYVQETILNDDAYGETEAARFETLRRGGLDIYTTLDFRVQMPAEASMAAAMPTFVEGTDLGATAVTIEPGSGRILAMVQNTEFSEDPAIAGVEYGYKAISYAGDEAHGGAIGFSAGSTYKLFTLVDWLEKGRSINEVLNGSQRAFNWTCDGVEYSGTRLGNYGGGQGYTGTVTRFTADSLNSGFLAMAEQLDTCEINRVADRFGVKYGNGVAVTVNDPETEREQTQYDVLGSKHIAPIDMASAYATIANNGVRCIPHAIDRIVDAEGNELEVPETGCETVVEPNIAATAAGALQSVMSGGGTGARANPGDGTPMIGKTGTHESWQTWMIGSSTAATTAVWVGNASGFAPIERTSINGQMGNNVRYGLARDIQAAANAAYPGQAFPEPDPNLTRQVLVDLPDVTGMSIDQATGVLREAGFQVSVGDSVPGDQPEGTVQSQDPGAGQVPRGSIVTLFPSNGDGASVPDVSGLSVRAAFSAILGAGFSNVDRGDCTARDGAGEGTATGTDPASGTTAPRGTPVRVHYEADSC